MCFSFSSVFKLFRLNLESFSLLTSPSSLSLNINLIPIIIITIITAYFFLILNLSVSIKWVDAWWRTCLSNHARLQPFRSTSITLKLRLILGSSIWSSWSKRSLLSKSIRSMGCCMSWSIIHIMKNHIWYKAGYF